MSKNEQNLDRINGTPAKVSEALTEAGQIK
jgi:hypothetical protein